MKEKLECYPVIIATLNRYEHFVRCIESLKKNSKARETELVLGLDYPPSDKYREGYNMIKDYITRIQGFGKVTIFQWETNLGPVNNFNELLKYAFDHYNAVILSEDDNEFSSNFLEFMNLALHKFETDEKISSVSGYNYPNMYYQNGKNAYLRKVCVAFGLGLWRDKYALNYIENLDYYQSILESWKLSAKIFITSLAELRMLIKMVRKELFWADVCRTTNNIIENKYQLAPAISLVRNHGYDGSGEHCGVDDMYATQYIDEKDSFVLNGLNTPNTLRNRWNSFICMQSRKPIDIMKSIAWTLIEYIRYRRNNEKV